MAPIGAAVFATLLMNDEFLPGAMVLGHSLRDRGARGKLIVLVTVDRVSSETITELKTVYDDVVPVQQITNKQPANLYVMNRPDLISTFTKIELWKQTQYKRIVYLDADTVVLRAPNELLTLNTEFAAVPDIGWPDCFNSGVMVLNPNMGDYYSLLALAQRGISFDGADQGLLNMHYRDWERLSFTYNCTPSGNYQYVPAYRHFSSNINVVHFIGRDKPWTLGRENRFSSGVYGELLGMWWAVYDRHYRGQHTEYYTGSYSQSPKKVQDYVYGEETQYLPSYAGEQKQSSDNEPTDEPVIEQPMGDAPTDVEQISQQDFKPTPTVEQRRFSAPHIDWEPARGPPPANSKPEASNFPTHIYDMSSDPNFFQPPSKYPDAPKGMYYEVPQSSPGLPKPKPIFPWEAHAPKPTRVFPQAKAPSPPPEPEPPGAIESGIGGTETALESQQPTTVDDNFTAESASSDPWASFQQRSNAWDEMPEIERYVQAFHQSRKGKLQVLHHTPSQPASGISNEKSTSPEAGRRPSMKLTDFPTEIERPSLPVTPAPIKRTSFWGEARDEAGNLPAADGVPKQDEWNPGEKLEELQRKQSEVMLSPTGLPNLEEVQDRPTRQMPESKNRDAAIEAAIKSVSPESAPKKPKSILKEPKIGLLKEDQSPTETTKNADTKTESTTSANLPQPDIPTTEPSIETPSGPSALAAVS